MFFKNVKLSKIFEFNCLEILYNLNLIKPLQHNLQNLGKIKWIL